MNSVQILHLCLIALALHVGYSEGANVGMFCVFGSKSMKEMFYGIAEALTERGHNVTFYSAFAPSRKMPGLVEVVLQGDAEAFDDTSFGEAGPVHPDYIFDQWYELLPKLCGPVLNNEHVMQLYRNKEKTYDVALADLLALDCILPVAEHSSKSLIQVDTAALFCDLRWMLDVPLPFATSPAWQLETRSSKMSFLQRLRNTYYHLKLVHVYYTKTKPDMDKAVQKAMPGLKTIDEVRKLVSLVLVNWNPATGEVGVTADFLKNVAGVNIKDKDKRDKLPKDLEEFINGSGDAGFIYISFGTVVPENKMPKHVMKALVEAFSKIPYRVIWKFRKPIPGLSPNVKIVSWAPQQSLLAHPKIRTFITHAGLFSTIESVNFGVPCIGFPVFADQPDNIHKMVTEGMGIEMIWSDVDTQKVLNAINSIVNNPSYKENAIRLQKIFTDRLVSPKEEAAYWVEYTIRHNGSTHMRIKADHLNLFQYLLIDVFAFIGAVVLVAFYLTYRVIRMLLCGGRKKQAKSLNKKNQ